MDTLVAKYSRPAYAQNEGLTEQDEMDFADGVPGPSLKFAMPPVAQVWSIIIVSRPHSPSHHMPTQTAGDPYERNHC